MSTSLDNNKRTVLQTLDHIQNGDIDQMLSSIDSFYPKVTNFEYDDYYNLLAIFLKQCVYKTKSDLKKEVFLAIMDVFDREDDYIPMYSRLWFLTRYDNIELWRFLTKVYYYSFSTYVYDLARYESYPEDYNSVIPINDAVVRLEKTFGKLTGNELINLRTILSDNGLSYVNEEVLSYVENELLSSDIDINNIDVVPVPAYIDDFEYDGSNDYLVTTCVSILNKYSLLGINGFSSAKRIALQIPDEEIRERRKDDPDTEYLMNLREFVYRNSVISTPKELYDLMNIQVPCSRADQKDGIDYNPSNLDQLQGYSDFISRILGPCNPFGDMNYYEFSKDTDVRQDIYDRMFACVAFENGLKEDYGEEDENSDHEEEDDPFSWFEHICVNCSKYIMKPWYAVRAPVLPGGGWCGCYCSWKCVRESMTTITPDMDAMISRFEDQMKEVGVHDREW